MPRPPTSNPPESPVAIPARERTDKATKRTQVNEVYGERAVTVTLHRLLHVFAPRRSSDELPPAIQRIDYILDIADEHNISAQTVGEMLERACDEETAARRAEKSDQSSSSRGRPAERSTASIKNRVKRESSSGERGKKSKYSERSRSGPTVKEEPRSGYDSYTDESYQ